MGRSNIRVLIVDDYEPWLNFERLTLAVQQEVEIIGECSDGDEAIQKADELKPDLVLFDIGGLKLLVESGRFRLIPKFSSSVRIALPT